MIETMTKVRVVLQFDEEARDALRLESALTGKDMGVIMEELIREHLSESLEQIRTRREKAERAKKKQ